MFQNIYSLEQECPQFVLILGGDHVYKRDYRELIAAHLQAGAAVTGRGPRRVSAELMADFMCGPYIWLGVLCFSSRNG